MSCLELNNPVIAGMLAPAFAEVSSSKVTLQAPPVTSDVPMQTAIVELSTGNALDQTYKFFATNGTADGLFDGQLQLLSYNTSSDAIVPVLSVAPQTDSDPLLLQLWPNLLVGGGDHNQLLMTGGTGTNTIRSVSGNLAPSANTLYLGTGDASYVALNNYKLQVIASDGVTTGQVYDDAVHTPPTGAGGIIASVPQTNPAGSAVPIVFPSAGTYLVSFVCTMACDGSGVAAGANISFAISELGGTLITSAFAPVSVASGALNLQTQASALAVIAAAGTYNFIGSPQNTGTPPVYTSYSSQATACRLF